MGGDHRRVPGVLLLPRVHCLGALRMLKPWLFIGFMLNAPLVQVSNWLEGRLGPRFGNLSMWLFIVVGQPLLVMTYYHDYVVEHHGSALIAHFGHLSSAPL